MPVTLDRFEPTPSASARRIGVIPVTSGCFRSLMDTQEFIEYLNKNNYEVVPDANAADWLVLFSCAGTEPMEQETMTAIRRVRRDHPHKPIVVTGCLPHINPAALDGLTGVYAIGCREMARFDELLRADYPLADLPRPNLLTPDLYRRSDLLRRSFNLLRPLFLTVFRPFSAVWPQPLYRLAQWLTHDTQTHFVHASDGCLGQCSYCAVRFARGRHRSQPFERVVAEVEKAVAAGKKKIWLLCDDLGPYGTDIGHDAAELLNAVSALPGDFHFVVSSFGPEFFLRYFEALRPTWEAGKLISLTIPLQTGSPDVLRKMNRHYDIGRVIERLAELRRLQPQMIVKGHLLIGHPGETEADFAQSLALLPEFEITTLTAFSPRPNTPAARETPVPVEIANRRLRIIAARQRRLLIRMILGSFLPFPPFRSRRH